MPGPALDPDSRRARAGRAWQRHRGLAATVMAVAAVLGIGRGVLPEDRYESAVDVAPAAADTPAVDGAAAVRAVAGSAAVLDAAAGLVGTDAAAVQRWWAEPSGEGGALVRLRVAASGAAVAREAADAYAQALGEALAAAERARLGAEADQVRGALEALATDLAEVDGRLAELLAVEAPGAAPSEALRSIRVERDALVARRADRLDALAGLDARIAATTGADVLRVLAPAPLPWARSAPDPGRSLAASLAAGAVLAVLAALARDRLSGRVRSGTEAARLAGAPLLGWLPRMDPAEATTPVLLLEPDAPAGEALRSIRTALVAAAGREGLRVLVVAGVRDGDGATTVAANLAAALAFDGRRVSVVDADLRDPTLHERFLLQDGEGLTEVLRGARRLADVAPALLADAGEGSLRIITAGGEIAHPAELLGSDAMDVLLEELDPAADVVLFDAPALLGVTDAAVLGQRADGVLLVVDAERTRRRDVEAARAVAERSGVTIVGTIVNRA